jgi:hypothetical protein
MDVGPVVHILVHILWTEVAWAPVPGLDICERSLLERTPDPIAPFMPAWSRWISQDWATIRRVMELVESAPQDHSLLSTGSGLGPVSYSLLISHYAECPGGMTFPVIVRSASSPDPLYRRSNCLEGVPV